ncbi:unnamed protein product [Sphagnum troendelagicum]
MLVQRCTHTKNLVEGRKVYAHLSKSGLKADMYLLTAVLSMFCKCGSFTEACQVFDMMQERDVFTWTLMLAAYAKHGLGEEGFKLYEQVRDEELKFDKIMYTSVVSVCASLGDLEKAKSVHQDIIRRGIELDAILEANLVHMYARCGSMKLAHEIFDKMVKRNFVAWTAMIAGSAQHGTISETFEFFQQMQQEHVKPDSITYISLLNACTSPAALKKGQWVYNHIIQAGLEGDVRLRNALINMFTKCGSIQDAQQAFDRMKFRDVISWNTMINSYAEHGPYGKAIEVFHQMQQEGIDPDRVTFICFLKACANQASLAEGKWAHGKIQLAGLGSDLRVGTALIDMYAKCGSIVDALHVFHMMPERNTVTWSAMIVGLGQHGHGRDALQHYHQMLSEGVKPDVVTFTGVLSACSHAGLVEEGLGYFSSMSKDHGISPAFEHFGCVVDLLARAGQLEKTDDFLNKMPQPPAAATWKAVLGACSLHSDLKLAEHAAQMLLALELQDAVAYVSLSHVYTSAGLQQKVTLLWKLMQDKGLEDERTLLCDKEKLSIVFSTPPDGVVYIRKNQGVCDDCHTVTKSVSKLHGWEKIATTSCHFHHFRDRDTVFW